MDIRRANLKDVKELEKLNKRYFGEFRNYSEEIKFKNTVVLVGENDGKIIGISGLKINKWNNTGWLLNIFVCPEFRKAGMGSLLVKAVIDEAKNNNLRCLIAEAPSKGSAPFLFKKLGFRKCGYNDKYYSNDSDEIAEFYSFDLN